MTAAEIKTKLISILDGLEQIEVGVPCTMCTYAVCYLPVTVKNINMFVCQFVPVCHLMLVRQFILVYMFIGSFTICMTSKYIPLASMPRL